MGEKENAFGVLVANLRERDHLLDQSIDCKYIRMNLKEVGWEGVDCINL